MENTGRLTTFANTPLPPREAPKNAPFIFGLGNVPKKVFFDIASFVATPKDLKNLSLTCKKFDTWINKTNESHVIWKNCAHNLFPSNSISENIQDYKKFTKNQIFLFKGLPTALKNDKKTREKFKEIPKETENNLCPFTLKKTSTESICVWKEEDGTALLCKHETNRILLTELDVEAKRVTNPKVIKVPPKKNVTESKIVCSSALGNTLFLGINYKKEDGDANALNAATTIPVGMVVLIDKKKQSLITTIRKEFRFVEEVQFSDETSKIYVKFAGAEKPWYCYKLDKKSK